MCIRDSVNSEFNKSCAALNRLDKNHPNLTVAHEAFANSPHEPKNQVFAMCFDEKTHPSLGNTLDE